MAPILDFINSAKEKQKLKIAVQEIDNIDIARAITDARRRGVTVDLVIEQSYLLGKEVPADPFIPGGPHEINRQLHDAILRSTVDVKTDFNSKIFHQKFMILGNSVLTGSTNFTTTGVTKNLNHVAVVDDAEVRTRTRRSSERFSVGTSGATVSTRTRTLARRTCSTSGATKRRQAVPKSATRHCVYESTDERDAPSEL